MDLSWIDAHFDRADGFPRPDWNAILPRIETEVPEPELRVAITVAAAAWLKETARGLGDAYHVDESTHFLLLSSLDRSPTKNLLRFLDQARGRILKQFLPGIAEVRGRGKHAALVFANVESYYSYIAYFYPPQGEFAASGGVFVQRKHGGKGWGYGHFVTYGKDVGRLERTVAHELTHNCLRHLAIPGWLNEGLASTVESALMGDSALVVRREDLEEHREHWKDGRIQEFWSGAAVHRPDEGSRLTYRLARMAVKALAHDYARFREFALCADRKDAGEEASKRVFGRGLGGLVEQFLGPGDWSPRPDAWTRGGA
jgi:hypothetical protein